MSWEPGLITHIDDQGMSVKVRSGVDCAACPGKMACSFQGPDSAYRTLRVQLIDGCAVGDRLMVEEPASVLGVALLLVLALPLTLMLTGYWLAANLLRFPYAALILWLTGIAVWVGALYVANRWMSRSPRFQTAVRQPAVLTDTSPADHPESKDA
jgi:positive regulator of sigma E activity